MSNLVLCLSSNPLLVIGSLAHRPDRQHHGEPTGRRRTKTRSCSISEIGGYLPPPRPQPACFYDWQESRWGVAQKAGGGVLRRGRSGGTSVPPEISLTQVDERVRSDTKHLFQDVTKRWFFVGGGIRCIMQHLALGNPRVRGRRKKPRNNLC